MRTSYGDLTYCTNIHAGEGWDEHFAALRRNIPAIKKRICPDMPYGIGLRLSNQASLQLQEKAVQQQFRDWLDQEQCYVFTMNGFPYGGFHHTRVKDQVHAPDWTTPERTAYTIRLFEILTNLVAEEQEGGISTSPLSYKHWHAEDHKEKIFEKATQNLLYVVERLIHIHEKHGKLLHLDIEPEPDGLLESGPEFLEWYERYLIPMGKEYLSRQMGLGDEQVINAIKDHVRLCYDVCHFAVGYENHEKMIQQFRTKGIKVGKIQISAALKAQMPHEPSKRKPILDAFSQFNESTYLHQVVALQNGNTLKRYPDLPQALSDADNMLTTEWRSHFHVPLFIQDYEYLKSTQEDIRQVLTAHRQRPFTAHLEVETYTWEVLPDALKLPIAESIIREMEWVINYLNHAD